MHLHHFLVFQKVQVVHEVPLLPVSDEKIKIKELCVTVDNFNGMFVCYLQLDRALQPRQGHLGNPVVPAGAMTKQKRREAA